MKLTKIIHTPFKNIRGVVIQKITVHGKISGYAIRSDSTKKRSYVSTMLNTLSIMLSKLNFPM